jgi:uroporphyrinogen-III decarboxylase
MDWNEAMTWASTLEYAGYRGWRLPTKEELVAFIKKYGTNPTIFLNSNGFNNVKSSVYWTSSSFSGNATAAWGVIIDNCDTSHYGKRVYNFAWPVR